MKNFTGGDNPADIMFVATHIDSVHATMHQAILDLAVAVEEHANAPDFGIALSLVINATLRATCEVSFPPDTDKHKINQVYCQILEVLAKTHGASVYTLDDEIN